MEELMAVLRRLALVLGAIALSACSGSGSTSPQPSTPTTPTTSAPASSAASAGPFTSTLYDYTVTSRAWSGTSASAAWDGTGSPGDGDPTVDTLVGPEGQRAFAYGEKSKATLAKFVARARAMGAKVRPDCAKPEATRAATIDHEPAIVDEVHCPAKTGVFALTASVVHGGRVYVIFTYDQPGDEVGMRAWFGELLKKIDLST
jgi:hypothetical protein